MEVEMQVISGSNGATNYAADRVVTGEAEDVSISCVEAAEGDALLHPQACVGERTHPNGGPAERASTPQESLFCRVRNRLQGKLNNVSPKARLGIIIFFICVLIILIIITTMAVCAAIYEDEDEKFDASLFKVPLNYSGSFRLPNQVFTEDLINMSSNQSQVLAANLQEKIAGLYTSSPALGRYFSEALINAFSNGGNESVIAGYRLKFLMPEGEEDQLRKFTLSREVVFNVFRQFLYDQEVDLTQPLFISPDSLQTF